MKLAIILRYLASESSYKTLMPISLSVMILDEAIFTSTLLGKKAFSTIDCHVPAELWRMLLGSWPTVSENCWPPSGRSQCSNFAADMRIPTQPKCRYPGLQNVLLDIEDNDHNVFPGAWGDDKVHEECQLVRGTNVNAGRTKIQRFYLKHYLKQWDWCSRLQINML